MKILLARVDGIGDLVSSLPVDSLIENDDQVTWLISHGLGFICQNSVPPRKFITVSKRPSVKEFFALVAELKQYGFDKVLIFHAPWWVSLAVFMAGIKWRGGKRSQWHSYLFLSQSHRQSRKSSDRHESEYNAQLLCHSFKIAAPASTPILTLSCSQIPSRLPEKYFVVHPGMMGSALNIGFETYIGLIDRLSKTGKVVITGTAVDADYLTPLAHLKSNPNVLWMVGEMTGEELIGTLENALGVVVPSTGVAHLAASVQAKTVALLPPIRRQAPLRWQPRGPRVSVLVPEVDCPAESKCIGEKCPQYYCMDRLTAEIIAKQIT